MDWSRGDNLPNFGAGNVDFNANCFPSSTTGNNGLPVNNARCVQIWNGVLLPAPSVSAGAGGNTVYGAQGAGTACTYTYRGDAKRAFTYDAATGRVAVVNP